MKKINIKDIAALCGVSVATVSRVINNSSKVKPETREEVLKVIKKYNFQPNLIARNLKTQKNNVIGLLIPRISGYYEEFVENIIGELMESGYNAIIATSIHKFKGEVNNFYMMKSKQVGGIIYYSAKITDEHKKALLDVGSDIPIIITGSGFEHNGFDSVIFDDYTAACDVVEYLYSKGHRRLGFISGPDFHEPGKKRSKGFMDKCYELGIKIDQSIIKTGCYSYKSGYNAMLEILQTEKIPDAVFCANDSMAIGAINAAFHLNLNVPRDISVMGFDNIRQSEECRPKITTVHQNLTELAANSVKLLLNRIEKKNSDIQKIILSHKIIERKSVIDKS